MAYFNICRRCGCNLDPGEKCDCSTAEKEMADFFESCTCVEPETGQLVFIFGREMEYEKKAFA